MYVCLATDCHLYNPLTTKACKEASIFNINLVTLYSHTVILFLASSGEDFLFEYKMNEFLRGTHKMCGLEQSR